MENKTAKQLEKELLYTAKPAVDKESGLFTKAERFCEGYKAFLDAGKTEREAAALSVNMLEEAGYGMAERMQEFTVSSATVELAAVAVGVEPARIAKTLSFKVDETPILVVAAGDAKVDNSKYKHFFHTKAKMLTPEEAVERIGHAVGGVCPFALPEDVKTYLDVSLKRFDTVFPAVGSAASAIELTCDELERCCGANFVEWVDVCKGWQEEQA